MFISLFLTSLFCYVDSAIILNDLIDSSDKTNKDISRKLQLSTDTVVDATISVENDDLSLYGEKGLVLSGLGVLRTKHLFDVANSTLQVSQFKIIRPEGTSLISVKKGGVIQLESVQFGGAVELGSLFDVEEGGIKAKDISYASASMIVSLAQFKENNGFLELEESHIGDVVFFGLQPYLAAPHTRVSGCTFTNITHTVRVGSMQNSVEMNADGSCDINGYGSYSSVYSAVENALYGCIFPSISTIQFTSNNNSYLNCLYTPHSVSSPRGSSNADAKIEEETFTRQSISCQSEAVQFVKDTFVNSLLSVSEVHLTVADCSFSVGTSFSSYCLISFCGFEYNKRADSYTYKTSASITGSTFTSTSSYMVQSALYSEGVITVGNCLFTGFHGTTGAAIRIEDYASDKQSSVYSCNITNIECSSGALAYLPCGGSSQLVVANCYFESCTASYCGGAIFIEADYLSDMLGDILEGGGEAAARRNTHRHRIQRSHISSNAKYSLKKAGESDIAIRQCAFSECTGEYASYFSATDGGRDVSVAGFTSTWIKVVEAESCSKYCTVPYTEVYVTATDCYTTNDPKLSFFNLEKSDTSIKKSEDPIKSANVNSKPDLSAPSSSGGSNTTVIIVVVVVVVVVVIAAVVGVILFLFFKKLLCFAPSSDHPSNKVSVADAPAEDNAPTDTPTGNQ